MNDKILHVSAYVGNDLALDFYDGGHPISIVTFEARDEARDAVTPSPFGQGFGLGRFAALGMNEFVVKRSRNHWYQTKEVFEVIDIINQRSHGTRLFTYGGSMGAFAAINFASKLRAEKFIALSPLYDVSIGNQVGDSRWEEDSIHIDFRYNLLKAGECRGCNGYVFYCSNGPDRAHAELIAQSTKGKLVPFEYGGHPISFLLNDTYGLKAIVKEITCNQFDPESLCATVKERAIETYYPYEKAALDFDAAGRTEDAISSITQAIEKDSRVQKLQLRLATFLMKVNDPIGAEKAVRAAIEIGPNQPHLYARLSDILSKRGELSAAIEQMRFAIELKPRVAIFHGGLGELMLKSNDWLGAELAFRKATEIDPSRTNPHVRLSQIYSKRNELSTAVKHMRAAVQLEPESSSFNHRLGSLLRELGNQAEAEKIIGGAGELKAKHSDSIERSKLSEAGNKSDKAKNSNKFNLFSIFGRAKK